MPYKRLTKWSEVGTLHVFDFCNKEVTLTEVTALDIDQIAGRLAALEDKIESGDLVDRAEVRKQTYNDCLRILRDINSPGIVEPFWVGWSEAINAAIKEIVKRTGKV